MKCERHQKSRNYFKIEFCLKMNLNWTLKCPEMDQKIDKKLIYVLKLTLKLPDFDLKLTKKGLEMN